MFKWKTPFGFNPSGVFREARISAIRSYAIRGKVDQLKKMSVECKFSDSQDR